MMTRSLAGVEAYESGQKWRNNDGKEKELMELTRLCFPFLRSFRVTNLAFVVARVSVFLFSNFAGVW